jgi:histidinol dehydrogenase
MIRIVNSRDIDLDRLHNFTQQDDSELTELVAAIIKDVKEKGDQALREYSQRFDGFSPDSFLVSSQEIEQAIAETDPDLIRVLKAAAANIEAFHASQVQRGFLIERRDGVITGQKITPIAKAGLYIPGGTAAYPSSVLMNAIPAKIAGCEQIIITTPPSGGKINPAILAAAKIAGVDRIFKIGGAQAIAAMAYGTESIPQVDKITGPGNRYVAEAKKQVYGQASIDMIAGPSEILIIADGVSDPSHLAADLLSQAEHDTDASAILVTDDPALAEAVAEEIERQIVRLARFEIARRSIDDHGLIILTSDIEEAIEVANRAAPEHLEICTDSPFDYLQQIRNAGSIFLGRNCPEAVGDYFAGPNHTLPTGGTARFSSPLSVNDFIKVTQFSYYSEAALADEAEAIAVFARAEGLDAHAESVLIRTGKNRC